MINEFSPYYYMRYLFKQFSIYINISLHNACPVRCKTDWGIWAGETRGRKLETTDAPYYSITFYLFSFILIPVFENN